MSFTSLTVSIRHKVISLLTGFIIIFATPFASAKSCHKQYYQQQAPSVLKSSMLVEELCMNGFSIGFSHQLRMPIWASEYLTRDRLKRADLLTRDDQFHEETTLSPSSRITLDEMKFYGYDRGHIAPHHDMDNIESQYDSFSLANIVLQNRTHNRKHWADIERHTRYMVYVHDDAYVVTGVILDNADVADTGVIIPSYLYKAIYFPKLKQAGAYVSKNSATNHTRVMSLTELSNLAKVEVMPELPETVKSHAFNLPLDTNNPSQNNHSPDKPHQNTDRDTDIFKALANFVTELIQMIKKLFI